VADAEVYGVQEVNAKYFEFNCNCGNACILQTFNLLSNFVIDFQPCIQQVGQTSIPAYRVVVLQMCCTS
jgi:hypothetical protein